MVNIQIKRITLHQVRVPLKKPFITHLQHVMERESILIEVLDADGTIGVGECVAFSSPWYTEETVGTAWDALEKWIIPSILNKTFQHPDEFDECVNSIKRHNMAKSCVNHALWDVYAKKMNVPLWKVIGGKSASIEAGIVVAVSTEKAMEADIESAISAGYKRVKLKISESSNPQLLKKIIAKYPNTLFFADANGDFTEKTLHVLKSFDDSGFTLIEQPFSEQQNKISACAQKAMQTPFALDESISSFQDVEEMMESQSGKIVVMKQGRVGGLSQALRIHRRCLEGDIPVWVGGMIEFGVSKAFNLAFASLEGVKFPGDFSSSSHFWEQDLTIPTIDVQQGVISLPSIPGVGVSWNHDIIEQFVVRKKQFNE
ncbi:o-succinylbenzoate synthase [Paenisporosarcina indica]|uniref:o-succinylbenzoate synthase n=1 Tax=Paenisporosarcina indica TaxID=650093 RepID=UPI00094F4B47|nr:o-succinylbenzoate synthase [Paenisporosarcina indica]